MKPSSICHNCVSEAFCLGSSILVPKPGFYRHRNDSTEFYKCEVSENCLGGYKINSTAENEYSLNGKCKYPSKGILCSGCE